MKLLRPLCHDCGARHPDVHLARATGIRHKLVCAACAAAQDGRDGWHYAMLVGMWEYRPGNDGTLEKITHEETWR